MSTLKDDWIEKAAADELREKQAATGLLAPDMVNAPPHYTAGNIECIDAITEAIKDLKGIEAKCTGDAIKYLWRWKRKNGKEDLKKAIWYIQHMIDLQP